MRQYSIFLIDFLRIRNWFRYQVGAKIFVALAFLLVVFLILIFEYMLSEGFFGFLSYQKEFGILTARYSFNAGFLVLFLLAIVSGIAAVNNALYRPEILRFLISTPISSYLLFKNSMAQVVLHSFLIMGLLLAPPFISYGRHFTTSPDYILRSVLVVVMLTLSSIALSSLFTIFLSSRFGRLSTKAIIFIFLLVNFAFFLFVQIFFSSSFFLLQEAESLDKFQEQLMALPLSSQFLPTNWFTTTIVDLWSVSTVMAFIMTIILVGIAFYTGSKLYIKSWQRAQEGVFLAGRQSSTKKIYFHFPSLAPRPLGSLYINELLGVIRSPSEAIYIAFLIGLLVILLFVGSKVQGLKEVSTLFLYIVYAIFLVGISYIFMTISARLIYPLMAKEKRFAWLLFSLPLKREKLLITKSLFTASLIFLSVPVGVIGGSLIALVDHLVFVFTLFLLVIVGFVAFVNLFIGIIAPNFAESDNPEAASTSGSGLVATSISFAFIVWGGFLFYGVVLSNINPFLALTLLCSTAGIVLAFLLLLAKRNINQYSL